MLKKIYTVSTSMLAVVVMLSSCTGEQVPGWEYMPDMYRGPSIQAYEANAMFVDSLSALEPAEGTVPRGFMTYESFPNTTEGYEAAKAQMMMPESIPTDSVALAEAAKLYGIYCTQCHGETGDGQGILVKNEVFLGVPSYADRQITLGSIFHVITYGKGVMGSHAAQVTPEERWKIAQHVLDLRAELVGGGDEEAAAEQDTTAQADASAGADTTNMENNQ